MSKLIIGCGYLGQRVAELWLRQGETVYATTRSEGRAAEFRRQGMQPVLCDVLDPDSLRELPEAETVLYCVGLDRSAGASMRQVYVEGLANVLQHLPRPNRMIYVSSTSVYGQTEGEEVDETAATEPLDESGKVVLDAEHLLRERRSDAVILRFAGIYGPGRLMRQQALQIGQPIATNPDHLLNLIHVEDGAVAVHQASLHSQPGQTYNICDDSPLTRRDFYTYLAEILQAPTPHFIAPTGHAVAGRDRANRRISNRKMREQLQVQLKYPSFKEGLRDSTMATAKHRHR